MDKLGWGSFIPLGSLQARPEGVFINPFERGEIGPDLFRAACRMWRIWGYPGNCQFASYEQCKATASGTDAYCGINPVWAFSRDGDSNKGSLAEVCPPSP